MLKKYRGYILPALSKQYELPKEVVHNELKRFLGIKSLKDLDHEELSYFVRFADNLLLINEIDIDNIYSN